MKHLRIVRNIHSGIKNLLMHKLRSFLTMLGVVFGVGSVIAMLAIGEGASAKALQDIRKLGSNNIIITTVKPESNGENSSKRSFMNIYGLKYEDKLRIKETIPHISAIIPAKLIPKKARLGSKLVDARIVGTTAEWFKVVQRKLIAGRLLTMEDSLKHRNVAVLTEKCSRKLLAGDSVLGQKIKVGSDDFTVIGVVQGEFEQSGNVQTPDREFDIYIPFAVSRAYFGDRIIRRSSGSRVRELVELHQIIIAINSTDQVERTADALQAMFKRFHKKNDYQINVPLALLRQAESSKRTFSIVLGSIAAISLLVGGIGIMNIMLASVTERTREIGIRRAIGAKKMQIVSQFLIETIVLSAIGGLLGIAFGITVPMLISHFTDMPTIIVPSSLVLSLGISMAVGIIFGIYPAFRAASLDPIVALRHE